MSELIKKQLLTCGNRKIKITLLDDFNYYGYIQDLDDDFISLKLERADRTIIIKLTSIKGVLIYED